MVRDGNTFYYQDRQPRVRPETAKVKLKKIERFVGRRDWMNRISNTLPLEVQERLRKRDEKALQEASIERPSRLKRSTRPVSEEILLGWVLNFIVTSGQDSICKEDLAWMFRVKEHRVEQIFHLLNRDGILSQRRPRYAHDTNRNPIFPGSASGWASDTYEVLDMEKAKERFAELCRTTGGYRRCK